MAHLLQVGAGSGGMPVLDMVCRDARVHKLTLIEPDDYKAHNVERHLFSKSDVGRKKAHIARDWIKERRPELEIAILTCDLCDPRAATKIENAAKEADIGVCSADNEPAKLHWDALMRRHRLPWTLGEVLSGGVGGFVHWFIPDGACYGCVASHLQRSITVDKPKAPDYSQPSGLTPEVTIPASKAAINVIASLHALVTLQLLSNPTDYQPGFTSMLLTLERVPDVFNEMYRPIRLSIERSPRCLICGPERVVPVESLDAALDDALNRVNQLPPA